MLLACERAAPEAQLQAQARTAAQEPALQAQAPAWEPPAIEAPYKQRAREFQNEAAARRRARRPRARTKACDGGRGGERAGPLANALRGLP